ncbi:MAG: substrate-binding domain-containing protein, partial [Eubacterium sp.]
MAFKKGECHFAPTHLLDEASGIYNIPIIQKYLGDQKAALIKGVKRVQGIMIPKGNPKNIQGIEDLARPGISFVNRQRGAGTRVLFDYLLKQKGIDKGSILGYEREMNTHMMVASAVDSGSCDAGMGVLSAANMMGLDFIAIGEEEYDFIVAQKDLEDEKICVFLEALRSEE